MSRRLTGRAVVSPQARAAVKGWARMVRLNRALGHMNGVLPRDGEGGTIRPSLSALQIRLKFGLKLGIESGVWGGIESALTQLQCLSRYLEHRLRKLEWDFSPPPNSPAGESVLSRSLIYLRDEVRRQISLTIALLEEARDTTSGMHTNAPLIRDTEAREIRHFDRANLERVLLILRDEMAKVERFEYRLLLLGTMKAGKTTSIAGMTGVDILPVRAEAMTTLPTLVRSEAGRTVPILNLRQAAKIRSFFEELRRRTVAVPEQDLNPGTRDAYAKILAGATIPAMPVEGAPAIRETVSLLNDGLRLAELAGAGQRYMEAFVTSDDLPVIDVEFSSLAGVASKNDLGRIVLVDSPGPNEAKHSDNLVKIVKEQIDRASALVVVTNYTILSGKDEAEMHALVESSAALTDKARNILLLNRYDEAKEGQDAPPEEMRDLLARRYPEFSGRRIFAVCAERAALSSRLKRRLNEPGPIDDPVLLKSFGRIAYGTDYRWQDASFHDPDRLSAKITRVWGLSFFDTVPLDGNDFREPRGDEETFLSCLRELAQNAARHCIGSALQVLGGNNDTLHGFLALRGKLENDEIQTLNLESGQIASDIAELENQKSTLNDMIETAMVELGAEVDQLCEELLDHVQSELDRVFQQARQSEAKRTRKPRQAEGFFSRILDIFKLPDAFKSPDAPATADTQDASYAPIDLDDDVGWRLGVNLSASTRSEANDFQDKLEASISAFVKKQCAVCHYKITATVKDLESGVKQHVEGVLKATLDKARARLGEAFTKELAIELEADLKAAASAGVGARAQVEVHHRDYFETVDQKGRWAAAKRWLAKHLDQDWGREKVARHEVTFQLSMEELAEIHLDRVKAFQTELRATVSRYVSEDLKSEVNNYHHEMVDYLEAYRTTISDTLSDHKLDAREREALKARILSLAERVHQLIEDIGEAMEIHLGKKQVVA